MSETTRNPLFVRLWTFANFLFRTHPLTLPYLRMEGCHFKSEYLVNCRIEVIVRPPARKIVTKSRVIVAEWRTPLHQLPLWRRFLVTQGRDSEWQSGESHQTTGAHHRLHKQWFTLNEYTNTRITIFSIKSFNYSTNPRLTNKRITDTRIMPFPFPLSPFPLTLNS